MAALQNEIFIGADIDNPLFYYANEDILSVNAEFAVNIVGEELSIDTMTATVIDNGEDGGVVLRPSDSEDYDGFEAVDELVLADDVSHEKSALEMLPYGTKIKWFVDGEMRCDFFVKNVKRIKKNQYVIDAMSAVGILDKEMHYGGVYYGHPFEDVLREILEPTRPTTIRIADRTTFTDLRYVDYFEITQNSHPYIMLEKLSSTRGSPVITFTMPDEWPDDDEEEYALFSMSRSSSEYMELCITKDEYRNQSQIDLGTNLKIKVFYGQMYDEWRTDSSFISIPYIEHGTRHSVGFIDNNLSIDGIFYRNLVPQGTYTSNILDYIFDYYDDQRINIGYSKISGTEDEKFVGLKIHDIFVPHDYSLNSSGTNPYGHRFGHFYPVWCKYNNVAQLLFHETLLNRDSNLGSLSLANNPTTNFMYDTGNLTIKLYDPIVPYTMDERLSDKVVTGWLPYASKRDNLYKLLFSVSANILKSNDGVIHIGFIGSDSPQEIQEEKIYDDGSVDSKSALSSLSIARHRYNINTNAETGEMYRKNDMLPNSFSIHEFDSPKLWNGMYSLPSPVYIWYANQNIFILTGNDVSGWERIIVLQGKPYTHVETTLYVSNSAKADASRDVSVTDCGLINELNIENVKNRLYQFYSQSRKVSNSILYDGQKPGNIFSFKNAFEENISGILSKVSLNLSSNEKANCEFYSGYIPTGDGGLFTDYRLISSGSGTFEFPHEVNLAMVVLVGGGCGGEDGQSGSTGAQGPKNAPGSGGNGIGGNGGLGGHGGQAANVLKVVLRNPSRTLSYSVGAGGSHYSYGGTPTQGNPTTMSNGSTTYTSANGNIELYINPFNGQSMGGKEGEVGVGGAKGGNTELTGNGVRQKSGEGLHSSYMGEWFNYYGGQGGSVYSQSHTRAGGGAGGGACYDDRVESFTKTGLNGNVGTVSRVEHDRFMVWAGSGGKGGTPSPAPAVAIGCGGNGGHGGGGGGAGGAAFTTNTGWDYTYGGSGGAGGTGGLGSDGGSGAILIMW